MLLSVWNDLRLLHKSIATLPVLKHLYIVPILWLHFSLLLPLQECIKCGAAEPGYKREDISQACPLVEAKKRDDCLQNLLTGPNENVAIFGPETMTNRGNFAL
jgi:hypothetical protein